MVSELLDDLDFELELLHRDEINVAYIVALIAKLKDTNKDKDVEQTTMISNLLLGSKELRSKKELIERFISEHLPHIEAAEDVSGEFEYYWQDERMKALQRISKEEGLDTEKLEKVIGQYLYTEKKPLNKDLVDIMHKAPPLKERKTILERITRKIYDFVETFIRGIEAA